MVMLLSAHYEYAGISAADSRVGIKRDVAFAAISYKHWTSAPNVTHIAVSKDLLCEQLWRHCHHIPREIRPSSHENVVVTIELILKPERACPH